MNSNDTKKDAAIEALLNYQQADNDGVMVLVSRQAIHEVVDELTSLRSPWVRVIERLPEYNGSFWTFSKFPDEPDEKGRYSVLIFNVDTNRFVGDSYVVGWQEIPPFDSNKDAAGLEGK